MKFNPISTARTLFSVIVICLFCLTQHSFAQDKMDSIGKQQAMGKRVLAI